LGLPGGSLAVRLVGSVPGPVSVPGFWTLGTLFLYRYRHDDMVTALFISPYSTIQLPCEPLLLFAYADF